MARRHRRLPADRSFARGGAEAPALTRPRAVFAGYFGFGNAGDEMLLERLLRLLPLDWTVLSGGLSSTENVRAVSRWNPAAVTAALLRSRALVFGGGEVFQASTSFASLLYYLALAVWARLCGRAVYGYGVSVDPALPAPARALTRATLSLFAGVWTRETSTLELLAGSRRPPRLVPDTVWDWPPASAPARAGSLLWVLRFPNGAADAEAWARRLEALSRLGWRHSFVAFHPAFDLSGIAALRARLPVFTELEAWRRVDELPALLARHEAVVSMRFHGVIIAALAGRPVVAVAGHAKVSSAAAAAGAPVLPPDADASRLADALERARREFRPRAAEIAALAAAARAGVRELGERLAG